MDVAASRANPPMSPHRTDRKNMRHIRHRSRLLAVFTAVALATVACSSDDDTTREVTDVTQAPGDDTSAPNDTAAAGGTAATDATDAPTGDTATDSTDGSDSTEATASTEPPSDDPANQNVSGEGEPVHGGTLVYGI